MKTALVMLAIAGLLGVTTPGPGVQSGAVPGAVPGAFPGEGGGRFVAVEVWIEPHGRSLAAYQVKLSADAAMRVVGVEDGEHPAFASGAYFDREAVDAGRADRLILAAFSLEDADRLPKEKTRLATVMAHIDTRPGADPGFDLQLQAAAGPDARPIDANVSLRVIEP